MLGLFGGKEKNIEKQVKLAESSLKSISETHPDEYQSTTFLDACAEFEKRINHIVEGLIGKEGKSPDSESCDIIARQMMDKSLMLRCIEDLVKIEFETRKKVVTIFDALVRKNYKEFATNYLVKTDNGKKILMLLSKGYENGEIALNCGNMLRECIKHPDIHIYILQNEEIIKPYFQTYLHNPNFDIGSDAFSTIKSLLTENKDVVGNYLNPAGESFHTFFALYNTLLESKNYVTQRQSLKILGDVLLDRKYFDIMMKYICETSNLILIMNLLRLNSPAIQFEAFHVFKIFVANPKKTPDIIHILKTNSTKLISFLDKLLPEKGDEQFLEEKKLLITTLQSLDTPEEAKA